MFSCILIPVSDERLCHLPGFNVPYKQATVLSRRLYLLLILYFHFFFPPPPCRSPSRTAVRRASSCTSGANKLDWQSARSASIKHLLGVSSTAAPADLQVTRGVRGEAGNGGRQFTLPKPPSEASANQAPALERLFF